MQAAETGEPAQGQESSQPTEKKEEEGEFLGGMMESLDLSAPGEENINDMGGTERTVAGGIDAVMDLTSKFLPFMQKPVTGRMSNRL